MFFPSMSLFNFVAYTSLKDDAVGIDCLFGEAAQIAGADSTIVTAAYDVTTSSVFSVICGQIGKSRQKLGMISITRSRRAWLILHYQSRCLENRLHWEDLTF